MNMNMDEQGPSEDFIEEPPPPEDDDDNSNDCYVFESDHAALKNNHDYRSLLKVIAILEAQRTQAIMDMDKLHVAREEAVRDPITFVQRLQQGEAIDLPRQQDIATIPAIDWGKYQYGVDAATLGMSRHITRLKRQLGDADYLGADKEGASSLSSLTTAAFDDLTDPRNVRVVRGRVKTETKPATFNQLWTVEEQKRLEELLTVHGPEEVEAKRWQKIAIALSNRTPQQVASRVQKYFIKLSKAGLPVPGRIPNIASGNKNKMGRHHQYRYTRQFYQPSTFLQAYAPPVYMSDDEDARTHSGAVSEARILHKYEDSSSSEESEGESIPLDCRHSVEYQQLQKLKALRAKKLQDAAYHVHHDGFKCDMCGSEPIIGTRWHCIDCPNEGSVDFCDDCVDSNHETETHNSSHRLETVRKKVEGGSIDQDYTQFMPNGNNYLDPNFMPIS